MNIKKITHLLFIFITLILSNNVCATAYPVPSGNNAIIGNIQYGSIGSDDTVARVAQRYDVGFNSIQNANPQMNGRFSVGTFVQIPTKHLLPNQARTGIVINLPEMRMYYFPKGSPYVYTYPIGIGKIGKTIPIKNTAITYKKINPTWTPPEDIREYNLDQGIVLPAKMPAGPDNPLGPYAIYMTIPTYLIHSTIFPESIGRRASFGCIRMYKSDIEEFFPTISRGIPVAIINSPVKAGWNNDRLYLEAHQPLEEHDDAFDASIPGIVHLVSNLSKDHLTLVDWQRISYIANERDGIPHEIGIRVSN